LRGTCETVEADENPSGDEAADDGRPGVDDRAAGSDGRKTTQQPIADV